MGAVLYGCMSTGVSSPLYMCLLAGAASDVPFLDREQAEEIVQKIKVWCGNQS